MALYKERKHTSAIMRFVSIRERRGRCFLPSLTFKDSIGTITYGIGDTYQGQVCRALGISKLADLPLAVGRQIHIWFGVNGNPQVLSHLSKIRTTNHAKQKLCPD